MGRPYVVSKCEKVEKHPHIVTAIAGSPFVLFKGERGSIRCIEV